MAPLYPVGIITSCLSPVVPFAVTSALATGKSPLLIWSLLLISPLVCNDDDDADGEVDDDVQQWMIFT